MSKNTTSTFYSGVRKLLWKQNIYSIHLHGDILFAAGSAVDGTAGKVDQLNKIIQNLESNTCEMMIIR